MEDKHGKQLSPSDIVIFGGMGDLSMRKILPALYHRLKDAQLPEQSRIVVLGRKAMNAPEFEQWLGKVLAEFVGSSELTDEDRRRFAARLSYLTLDANDAAGYQGLRAFLETDPQAVRIFYLATPADIFGPIAHKLSEAGLITPDTRVVLEKPLGYDLPSFREINESVLECFTEQQVYRIDHYLGKETVQNLMVLRFANNMLERNWHADAIDHVQITVAEEIGVGDRAGYYDHSGALRDMVQNHLLQLLCLVAMEPPTQLTPDSVRDEKLKVLRALRPIKAGQIETNTVRGQYRSGAIRGKAVASYLEDIKKPASETDTFVALKVNVDNWRWSNVPFYLRTGKRLLERYSEIVIQFKPVPHSIFPQTAATPDANKLIIRLQPDERVQLEVITKVPGPGGYRLKPVKLNLSFAEAFHERYPEAYERLLMDVVRGNPTLFMRTDEVEAAWIWTEYLLEGWKDGVSKTKLYPAGSWGPEDAYALIARDGRNWHHDD